ncbi:hypothetical protein SMU54_02216 [Streptococcus mutans A9]|nr:hypothetical protein SMU54_02216 [Streptococcus mutans A9]
MEVLEVESSAGGEDFRVHQKKFLASLRDQMAMRMQLTGTIMILS